MMRGMVICGARVLASAELPPGVEAHGVAGTRRRPGAVVHVRPELLTSERLPSLVAQAVNALWHARAA